MTRLLITLLRVICGVALVVAGFALALSLARTVLADEAAVRERIVTS